MKKTSRLTRTAIIAAIYACLTLAFSFLSFGPVQFRISEAMCVLIYFMPEAVWGLTAGCLIANAVGTAFGVSMPWDILFGTLATLLASVATLKIKNKWLLPLPTIIFNGLIVGTMLTYLILGSFELAPLLYNILTVSLGEIVVCYVLGIPLFAVLKKTLSKNFTEEK